MDINELKPADVLLYSGQSPVGKLIRKLDGTEVTHAGIYLGNGKVGEALMARSPGINANPISLSDTNWVDVRRLADFGLDQKPIILIAKKFIAEGNRYAYAEILLLAVILVTRKINIDDSVLGRIAFSCLKRVNNWIEEMFSQGREPMICSEFAFRCYDEADPTEEDPYTLAILSQAGQSSRRRFSRFRRRDRILEDQPENNLPTIHPDSLLAESLKRPTLYASVSPDTQPEVTDDELENMIAEYLGEETTATFGATSAALTAPVTEEQLIQVAAEFSAKLGSSQRRVMGTAPYSNAPIESSVRATFADFVTPGDLLKSPSLVTVGRIPGK